MKVVYEFVVADRADSQLLAQSPLDQLSLPYFRCFGLDPANLAALFFNYRATLLRHLFTTILRVAS